MLSLITAADVATPLGVSATDVNLVRIVAAVNEWVKRRCNRSFELVARTEIVRGYMKNYVFLRESPIASIAQVLIDWSGIGDFTSLTPQDLTKFAFDSDPLKDDNRLFILSTLSNQWPDALRAAQITYTAGWNAFGGAAPAVPDDLHDELIGEAAERYRRGVAERFKSQTLGAFNYSRFDGPVDPQRKAVIDRYRRW